MEEKWGIQTGYFKTNHLPLNLPEAKADTDRALSHGKEDWTLILHNHTYIQVYTFKFLQKKSNVQRGNILLFLLIINTVNRCWCMPVSFNVCKCVLNLVDHRPVSCTHVKRHVVVCVVCVNVCKYVCVRERAGSFQVYLRGRISRKT